MLDSLLGFHILIKADDTFRFIHQQFQEWFTSQFLLSKSAIAKPNEQFLDDEVLNNRFWEEALFLLAEHLTNNSDIVRASQIVNDAAQYDLLFSCWMARRCGEAVWAEVSAPFGQVLRKLYASDIQDLQEYALAAMIASGSDDFKDVILPLLSHNNNQTRLHTYRAGDVFPLSLLGKNYKEEILKWPEDKKAELIGEVMMHPEPEHIQLAVYLAQNDPSWNVRVESLTSLYFRGMQETADRVIGEITPENLPVEAFEELSRYLPSEQKRRFASYFKSLFQDITDLRQRMAVAISLDDDNDPDAVELMKQILEDSPEEWAFRLLLSRLHSRVPDWISDWVLALLHKNIKC